MGLLDVWMMLMVDDNNGMRNGEYSTNTCSLTNVHTYCKGHIQMVVHISMILPRKFDLAIVMLMKK